MQGVTYPPRLPGYSLTWVPGGAGHAPADATTYYTNALPGSPTTSSGSLRLVVPRAGIIRNISIDILVSGTAGTTENGTLDLFINGSTVVALSTTVQFNSVHNPYNFASLSQAVAIGDYLELRWLTPTWATNPTGVFYGGNCFIELP